MNDLTVLQACRLLFGDEVVIGKGFLDYLQPGGLKSAYRRRLRETHPDIQATAPIDDIAAFFAVQQAFQVLTTFLQERNKNSAAMAESDLVAGPAETDVFNRPLSLHGIGPIVLRSTHRLQPPRTSIDRLYQGPLPERSLLFGHFLYYSGLTTWRTITAILVQQQKYRPRCGELGTRFGMLSPEDILRILEIVKKIRKPFGEVAVEQGLLSERQLQALLRRQRLQQKKFGTILVEKELITVQELATLLTLFRRHNRVHDRS